jgi:thiamine kinase-like enzyme
MSDVVRLKELPIWRGTAEVEPSSLGRTNSNFIIDDGGSKYFARVGRELPHHFIDRITEARCCLIAAQAGIGPKTLYAEGGILVMALLEGRSLVLADGTDGAMLAKIANLLRRLHAIPVDPEIPQLSPVQLSLRYLSLLDDSALPAARRRIASRLANLRSGEPRCVVHGDLIPENFLLSNSELYLVDWEYAGIGFPEIDLALTIANFELSDELAELLLDAYGDVDRHLLADMKVAAIIREALWCAAQGRFGATQSADLSAYTVLCNQRLERALA